MIYYKIYKVFTPAKNTTPNTKNLQLNDSEVQVINGHGYLIPDFY